MIPLTNFKLQASDLDCRSHCMDSQPQDRVDPYPCHLGVWSSPNSSVGGAHLCYSLVWSCDLQRGVTDSHQVPNNLNKTPHDSPPQKKKKQYHWCNHPSPAATCMRCLRITLSFSSAFSKCSKSTDAKRALVLGPVQSNFDKNWWP